MKYLIIAGGDGTRWNNYLGLPKHFAPINGEAVIHRTIRQIKERMRDGDEIIVASKDYQLAGVTNAYVIHNEANYDADKFLSSATLWTSDMMIIYGDVYFSDRAMDIIVNYTGNKYRLFCNPYPNKVTGTEWGECFAIFIPFWQITEVRQALALLIHLYNDKKLWRIGGWELTRLMMNAKNLNRHRKTSRTYYIIQDETDDVDYPADYERLREAVENGKL